MSETEVRLNSRLFGGYDKKSTEAYIEELQTAISKLQEELLASRDLNEKYIKRINEAEMHCKSLQERDQEMSAAVRRLKNELEMNQRVIEVQKEKNRIRSNTVRQQEELLKEKDEELRLSQKEIETLKDRAQKGGEQMFELECKLEQKVQVLKEQEKTIAQLKDTAERLQYMYEESQKNQESFLTSKIECIAQEAMKIVNGWKR